MLARVARLRRMPGSARRVLAEAALLMPLVGASLRTLGFRRTYRRLDRPLPELSDAAQDLSNVAEAVALAARHIPLYRPTCLPQSLVLWHLLRRRGVPVELRLGVATAGGAFTAHAWVEYNGQVINDASNVVEQYAPLDLPRAFLGEWS